LGKIEGPFYIGYRQAGTYMRVFRYIQPVIKRNEIVGGDMGICCEYDDA